MTEPILTLQGVSRSYPLAGSAFTALHPLDLQIHAGEIRAITGPSGSGKTTLLQILGLLDSPSSGTHHFLGRDMIRCSESERTQLRAESISFLFQDNWLLPWLTALENVLAPQVHLKSWSPAHKAQAQDLLEQLGLAQHQHKRVTKLSGGQRQRVCLARALLKKPRLVIADEPSASLDSHTTAEVLDLLLDLREREQCAIVLATHDPALIEPLRSHLCVLRDGKLQP